VSSPGVLRSIHHQRLTPTRQTRLPRPMAHGQPKAPPTRGVTTGASTPPPLPPVLKMPAAVAPRRPPSSSAVAQNGPSVPPTAAGHEGLLAGQGEDDDPRRLAGGSGRGAWRPEPASRTSDARCS